MLVTAGAAAKTAGEYTEEINAAMAIRMAEKNTVIDSAYFLRGGKSNDTDHNCGN